VLKVTFSFEVDDGSFNAVTARGPRLLAMWDHNVVATFGRACALEGK